MYLERAYQVLLDHGYPKEGVDWMRRRRVYILAFLVLLSWGVVIGLGSVLWKVFS